MTEHTCIHCSRRTVSVIKTDAGAVCYNCYAANKTPAGSKRPRNNAEASIQEEFFKLAPMYFPDLPDKLLFAVPNGGSRNKAEAANLKRQGVKRGISDVILQIPRKGYAGLCLEFKTPEGRQSDEQKEYQRQTESAGNKYVIVRSVGQALQTVKEYLE
jgi:hypothetical protein